MSLHTPGPWGVEQSCNTLWVGPMRPDGAKVDQVITSLSYELQMVERAKIAALADANLIAAAPDLLNAVKDMITLADLLSLKSHDFVIRAHAAVAKARGEA